MKSNELRLGNLFTPINRSNPIHLPTGKIYKICTIGFSVGAIPFDKIPAQVESFTEFQLRDLSEIPLTEKWLLDFGFKKSTAGEGGDNYVEYYENSNLVICNWGDGFIMSNSFSHGIRVSLKYVHQLQNLYFAITAKELSCRQLSLA